MIASAGWGFVALVGICALALYGLVYLLRGIFARRRP